MQLMPFNSIALLACVLMHTSHADTPVYRYTDANGVLHLSSKPPTATAAPPAPTVLHMHNRDGKTQISERPYTLEKTMDEPIDQALLRAIIEVESNWNPQAISPKGATGLMQLMPATAAQYGVNDLHDPLQNLQAGTQHLRYLMQKFKGDLQLVLAAYNAGEGAVLKYGRTIPPYPETQAYVRKVLALYRQYKNS